MIVDIIFVGLVLVLLVTIYKLKFGKNSGNQTHSSFQHLSPRQPDQVQQPSWMTTNDELNEEEEQQKQEADVVDHKKQMRKQQKAREKKQKKQAMEQYLKNEREKKEKYDEQQAQKDREEQQKRIKEEEYYQKLVEQEEKKKKQQYDKWKGLFEVKEEGKQKSTPEEQQKKKEEFQNRFCSHLKKNKLCLLEDLSHKFKMPTKEIIEKIKQLESLEKIKGIFDERGKYMVIENQEWEAIRNYIKARGRVKKTDIMQQCSRIIKIPEHNDENESIMNLMNEGQIE